VDDEWMRGTTRISEQLKGGQHPKQKNENDKALKSTEISWP